MRTGKTRLAVNAYAIIVFTYTLGGNAWRNLLSWPGFIAVALILVALGITLFIRQKPDRFRWYRLPAALYWVLTLAVLSLAWSHYRQETLLGIAALIATALPAISLAFVLTWHETLATLGTALRYLLGFSLLFEAWVSLFLREPLLPWWMPHPEGKISKLLWWSRDLLLNGGPIQGLLGSSVLMGFLALLALIVFGIQLRAGLVRPVPGWFWLCTATLTLLLTRAATVWVALAACAVTLTLALWARRAGEAGRVPVYTVAASVFVAVTVVTVFFHKQVFALLGKNGTLTGRTETWERVIDVAGQHPVLGWGWVSYWPTWVAPFKGLDSKVGLPVMSAHNAWLDVWMQLGVPGLIAFGTLVLMTMWRTWFRAVDVPRRGVSRLPYATSALWPALIMVALIVQSLTESRLLLEGNLLLLVLIAVKSRFDYELPARDTEPVRLPWNRVPLPGRH